MTKKYFPNHTRELNKKKKANFDKQQDADLNSPDHSNKMKRQTSGAYKKDPYTRLAPDAAAHHNQKVRELFEQKYPFPEGKNSKLMEAKTDALNNVIKEEMSNIIDNKADFYDTLSKRVTSDYRVVPGSNANNAMVAHQQIAAP